MTLTTRTTTFRFGACELDEASRCLRVHGCEVELQPRAFDVLAYLVRNRDRIVGKQELLEQLWPGSVVVDNALQRAVSLARSALGEGGAREVLRTYSRHGYRFCAESVVEGLAAAPVARDAAPESGDLPRGTSDWESATQAFAAADRQRPSAPDDLEAWGRAAIWAGRAPDGIAPLERAVAARIATGDRVGAARAVLLLAQIHTERREPAIAQGLVKRAETFLDGQELAPEHGHVAWVSSRLSLLVGDSRDALRAAERAYAIGREFGDPDLESLGLLYRGHALMALGEFASGVALHDEAAAAVIASEVSPWAGGLVYCGIISATRNRCDWHRAGQWTDRFTRWCSSAGMPAFPGTCRLHRAEVMSVRGELAEAAREVGELGALLSRIAPWAEGDAYRVLGDILLMQGDLVAAEAAFRRAHALGWEAQPGLARLQFARGRPEAALRGLERALEDCNWAMRERRGQLLATLVLVALAAAEPERARRALQELETDPQSWSTPALAAMVNRARAELAWEERREDEACSLLRQALQQWHDIGAPLSAAEARVRLAELHAAQGDRDAADLELAVAEATSQRLGAGALGARCEALRRTLDR